MQRLLSLALVLLLAASAALANTTPGNLGVATTTLVGGKFQFDQGPGTDTALGFNTSQFCIGSGALIICGGAITNAMLAGSIDLTSKVTGLLPIANGGTGTASPGLVQGTNITITGSWPNQTINSSGGGSVSVTAGTPNVVVTPSPGTGTFTVGTTVAQNIPSDGGSHSYTLLAGDLTKQVILASTFTAGVVPQATGSFAAGAEFLLTSKGAGTATSTTSTINNIAGATGIKFGAYQFQDWTSDGANWLVQLGVPQPATQAGATLLGDDMTWRQVGASQLSSAAVSYAKIQNGASAGLLGVNNGSAPTEVAIGSGLSLSAGTLTSTGSGASQALTRQRFTTGSSATYTTPANANKLIITQCGAGGGSGGLGAGAGTGGTGGTTTFNSVTTIGGSGGGGTTGTTGGVGGIGGQGGTGALGTGGYRITGGDGSDGTNVVGAIAQSPGGIGGDTLLGAFQTATASNNGAGSNGIASASALTGGSGAGGGGECLQQIITTPSATYTYTVGAAGTAGAGATGGTAGNPGVIIVDEYYGIISATLTNHGVLVGTGSAIGATSAGPAGQVLTSNGASADPTFQTSGGLTCNTGFTAVGGSCQWTTTISGAASIAFTGLVDNNYTIKCHGLIAGASGVLALQLGEGGGPTYNIDSTYIWNGYQDANGTVGSSNNAGYKGWALVADTTSGANASILYGDLFDLAQTSAINKSFRFESSGNGNTVSHRIGYYTGHNNVAQTAIRVIDTQGSPANFSGTCTLVDWGN